MGENFLQHMKLPRDRKKVWRGGVLQIRVTGACHRACPNCSQSCQVKCMAAPLEIEEIEKGLQSVQGYFGVIGVFGGEPSLHPRFEEICHLWTRYVPFAQRGIWSAHPHKHGKLMAVTFNPGVSNLNPHDDEEAWWIFKRDWPLSRPFAWERASYHAPVLVSPRDLGFSDEEIEALLPTCEINQYWSPMICRVRGELQAFFCEIAGMLCLLHEKDPDWPTVGTPLEKGWWQRGWHEGPPGRTFYDQVRQCCYHCGVPLRLPPVRDDDFQTPQWVTKTHAPWVSLRKGCVQVITEIDRSWLNKTHVIEYFKKDVPRHDSLHRLC